VTREEIVEIFRNEHVNEEIIEAMWEPPLGADDLKDFSWREIRFMAMVATKFTYDELADLAEFLLEDDED